MLANVFCNYLLFIFLSVWDGTIMKLLDNPCVWWFNHCWPVITSPSCLLSEIADTFSIIYCWQGWFIQIFKKTWVQLILCWSYSSYCVCFFPFFMTSRAFLWWSTGWQAARKFKLINLRLLYATIIPNLSSDRKMAHMQLLLAHVWRRKSYSSLEMSKFRRCWPYVNLRKGSRPKEQKPDLALRNYWLLLISKKPDEICDTNDPKNPSWFALSAFS